MKEHADWKQLLEALHRDLVDAEREVKQFVRAASAARDPYGTLSDKEASPDRQDPFQARAVAAAVREWAERVLPDVKTHAAALADATHEAAVRLEIDFWADLEEQARSAGFACQMSPSEQEATIESFVTIKVDLKKCVARVNGRTVQSVHVPLIWRTVEEEIARIKSTALPPERFVEVLSQAVRSVAARTGNSSEPVAVLEAYKELQQTRNAPDESGKAVAYSRQLFAVELSWFADARPSPVDSEGMVITLEPTTLPKNTIRVFSKRLGDYRRVGRLQRSRVHGLGPQ